MLIRRGDRWILYPHKVKYVQYGNEHEQWALPNKQWWIDFGDYWEHTGIIEFTEVELNEEQITRFEEIKDMPEDFADVYTEYVLTGEFPNDFPSAHPLMLIKAQKMNANNTDYLLDVDFRLMMVELGMY